MLPEPTLKLGQEHAPPDEGEAIRTISSRLKADFLKTYPPSVRPARRAPHAKGHGCISAEFVICDDIPEELRIGLFQTPRTYPALIRFSNGSSQVQPDWRPDVRGMAIKLLQPQAKSDSPYVPLGQDFVLINHPVFFVRNAIDFADFATRIKGSGPPLSFFFGISPFRFRLRELVILLQSGLKWPSSPLNTRYWSQTPYRLGSGAVKFGARPLSSPPSTKFSFRSNYLRESLTRKLSAGFSFEFLVQPQTCPSRMPIEDATVDWPEDLSPFRRVAIINLPAQAFNSPERLVIEENLSFTPWHALPEHRPMGGINRARQKPYPEVSDLRHSLNGIQEPANSPSSALYHD
jgi:hypothetical protein